MPITVTVLDTGSIQPFIFGSNVLRENIGASELVYRATRLWAFETLDTLGIPHNINIKAAKDDPLDQQDDKAGRTFTIFTTEFEADGSAKEGAEVLYAGGGNTVILFQGPKSEELAKDFVYRLSLRLLSDAPGLNIYAAHRSYTWENTEESLPEVVDQTLKDLGALKGKATQSKPALGFPVTAACTSTGLPANGRHPDDKGKTGSTSRANRQVDAKWTMALDIETNDDARTRLRGLFPAVGRFKEFDWADEFDELTNLPERDDSYIAVVHADGNGMGRRFLDLSAHWRKPENAANARGYIEQIRKLSIKVQETAQTALKNTLEALLVHLTDHTGPGPTRHATKVEYEQVNGERVRVRSQKIFPVRPLVFGGDDVTLVCAGPWGLAVAQRYLAELEKLRIPDGKGGESPPYACAGVAIVKTHYPFSQAYHLSEDLLKSAKARSKKLAKKEASALDWHFTTTGLTGSLSEIRDREYTVHLKKIPDHKYTGHDGSLHFRPIMLLPSYGWRNWDTLTRLMRSFGEGGDWQTRRNKTMRLREALRGGPERVDEFWAIFREEGQALPTVPLPDNATPHPGWVEEIFKEEPNEKQEEPLEEKEERERRSLYFDAIEVAEQFFELPDKKEGSA